VAASGAGMPRRLWTGRPRKDGALATEAGTTARRCGGGGGSGMFCGCGCLELVCVRAFGASDGEKFRRVNYAHHTTTCQVGAD
jgi:hypothetical protein